MKIIPNKDPLLSFPFWLRNKGNVTEYKRVTRKVKDDVIYWWKGVLIQYKPDFLQVLKCLSVYFHSPKAER